MLRAMPIVLLTAPFADWMGRSADVSTGIRSRLQQLSLIATICEPPSRTHSTSAVSFTLHHRVRIWLRSRAATTDSEDSETSTANPSAASSASSVKPLSESSCSYGSSWSGTASQKTVPPRVAWDAGTGGFGALQRDAFGSLTLFAGTRLTAVL